MPGYGCGAVVLPWSSSRLQHHAAIAQKIDLSRLFSFPQPPQSAVSRHIRSLTLRLGTALFLRKARAIA
jgi:hypothetical protein